VLKYWKNKQIYISLGIIVVLTSSILQNNFLYEINNVIKIKYKSIIITIDNYRK
jgi:hypothetical protein